MNSNDRVRLTCILAATSLVLAIAGCHRSTANLSSSARNVRPQMQEASGRTFELEYGAPRTPNSQWRYRGLTDDYHVMDYYGLGSVYGQPEYRYSIRTRKDNLPKGFPVQPQPPVKTTINPKFPL